MTGQYEKARSLTMFLMKSWLEPIIIATLIYYNSIYVVSRSTSPLSSDMGMMMLVIIYSNLIVFNLRIFFECFMKSPFIFIVTQSLSVLTVVAYVLITT